MSPRSLAVIWIVAGLAAASAPSSAIAQNDGPYGPGSESTVAPPPPLSSRRIEINPRPLLYRRCTDWYELQHRPSGTVLFPERHCWWVRG